MSFLNAYRYYLSAASFFGVAPYSYDGRDFRLNRPNQIINIIYIILTTFAFIFPLTGWGVQANSLTPTQIIGFSLIIHSTDFATHLYQLVIPISIFVHRHKIISHMNRLNSQRLMAEEPKLGYFFQSKRNFRISFGAQVFLIAIVNIAAYPPIETISELFRLLSSIFFGYMVIAALSHFFIFLHMACEAYRRMSTELRKRVISWRLIEEQAKFDIVVKDFIEMVNEVFGPILIAFFWVCLINTAQVEVYAVDSGVFSEQATRSYFAALNPFLFGIVVIRKFRLVVYAVSTQTPILKFKKNDIFLSFI